MKLLRTLAAAGALALSVIPALAQEFRLLSSWDQNYAYNPHILDPFVNGIKERTKGRINITVNGPETVAPFEQLEPVGSGVFQFLFTAGAYHFGTSPLMTAAETLEGDHKKIRESGMFDFFDKHYQQFGLKLVMLPVTPEGAYHIFLRDPVGPSGDLSGRKIRGSLTYKGVVEMLGGVLTVLPASEIYTGLEKGIIDGASWPIIGVLDYKWNEVANYLLRPSFGVNYEPIFMNLDAWNKLSAEDQNVILDVSKEVEDSWFAVAPSIWAEEEKQLLEKGMKITEMGAEQQAKVRDAWSAGLWALASEKAPAAAKEMRELAVSKGLTK